MTRSYRPEDIRRCVLSTTLTDAECERAYREASKQGKKLAVWMREVLLREIEEREGKG